VAPFESLSLRKFGRILLPDRLTWVDETNRQAYFFLQEDDRCLFFGEFNKGLSWSGGPTNQLIMNYKRTPQEITSSPNGSKLQYYKDKAINEIAVGLRRQFNPAAVARLTFVPLPSSKIVGDSDYCDRLEKTLRIAFIGAVPSGLGYKDVDIRLLLRQTKSTTADHRSHGIRLKYDELLAITEVDIPEISKPMRQQIVLFDDVLTSGKHYRVAKTRIREVLPMQLIIGVFVARVIHAVPSDEFSDLD
jgi:hypothetical protein